MSIISLVVQTQYQLKFRCGLACASGLLTLCFSSTLQTYNILEGQREDGRGTDSVLVLLGLFQIAASFAACVGSLSIPRRPDVKYAGRPVDQQYTASALNTWTLAWAANMLSLARSKTNLNLEDLPTLHQKARSEYLLGHTKLEARPGPLWKAILYDHWQPLLFQSIYGIVQSILQFAPPLLLFMLLRVVELKSVQKSLPLSAWVLVLALSASSILAAWIDVWTRWVGYAKLALQIRLELSGFVYAKATRRKDLKGQKEEVSEPNPESHNSNPSKNRIMISPHQQTQQDKPSTRNQQSEVNLLVSLK